MRQTFDERVKPHARIARYSHANRCYWGNGGGPQRSQPGHKAQEAGAQVGVERWESSRSSHSTSADRRGNRRDLLAQDAQNGNVGTANRATTCPARI